MERLNILEKKLAKMKEKGQDKSSKFGTLIKEYWHLKDVLGAEIGLNQLTPMQKANIKVEHFKLHLPAYTTKEQLQFIQKTAMSVINNEPVTIVHEEAMKRLLRWAYTYRNILVEFDEQDRWTEEDESDLDKIATGFKPILDWLVERYRINIGKFRRD